MAGGAQASFAKPCRRRIDMIMTAFLFQTNALDHVLALGVTLSWILPARGNTMAMQIHQLKLIGINYGG